MAYCARLLTVWRTVARRFESYTLRHISGGVRMAKDFSRAFYASADWERARDAALTRDAHLCQHCLQQGEITPAVMVHHIIELTPANISDPSIATDPSNLVSLCDRCHKKVHHQITLLESPE